MATLLTVRQHCKQNPAFTQGGIRHLIFHEAANGLAEAGAIIRMGRRVLIHQERFFRWLDAQNGIDTDRVDESEEVAA